MNTATYAVWGATLGGGAPLFPALFPAGPLPPPPPPPSPPGGAPLPPEGGARQKEEARQMKEARDNVKRSKTSRGNQEICRHPGLQNAPAAPVAGAGWDVAPDDPIAGGTVFHFGKTAPSYVSTPAGLKARLAELATDFAFVRAESSPRPFPIEPRTQSSPRPPGNPIARAPPSPRARTFLLRPRNIFFFSATELFRPRNFLIFFSTFNFSFRSSRRGRVRRWRCAGAAAP